MVESLLFIGARAGACEKNTWSRSWSKTDRLRNTDYDPAHKKKIVFVIFTYGLLYSITFAIWH